MLVNFFKNQSMSKIYPRNGNELCSILDMMSNVPTKCQQIIQCFLLFSPFLISSGYEDTSKSKKKCILRSAFFLNFDTFWLCYQNANNMFLCHFVLVFQMTWLDLFCPVLAEKWGHRTARFFVRTCLQNAMDICT